MTAREMINFLECSIENEAISDDTPVVISTSDQSDWLDSVARVWVMHERRGHVNGAAPAVVLDTVDTSAE